MKRMSAWVSTHLFVLAFIVCALGGITVAATGDKHLASGLLVDSNAQLVSTQRLATVGFSAGDHYLPNAMVVDANGQLVMTLRDSSGNALTPGAATTLTTTDVSTNATFYPIFTSAITGSNTISTDSSHATYNPNSGTLKVRAIDFSALIGANKAMCTDASSLTNNCATAAARPDFGALASTCSATLIVPCAFTWTCTMSSGVCTTTQAVPASSRCTVTPNVSPRLSSTNVVSVWVTLASTTLTINVSDMLLSSTAAFSGNGECL